MQSFINKDIKKKKKQKKQKQKQKQNNVFFLILG